MDEPRSASERSVGIEADLTKSLGDAIPDADGPIHVLGSTPTPAGGTDYEISLNRLVALKSDDQALGDVYVSVPVTGHVTIAPDGASQTKLAPLDESTVREVAAWARALIANGSVEGIAASGPAYGPPHRPTHELAADAKGRRVLRRLGFGSY